MAADGRRRRTLRPAARGATADSDAAQRDVEPASHLEPSQVIVGAATVTGYRQFDGASAGEEVRDSVIFSRLATLGFHKQELWDAGDEAAGNDVLDIYRIFRRVWSLASLRPEGGHSARIVGRYQRRAERADRAMVEHFRAAERAAGLPPARDEALAMLAREGVTIADLKELQDIYAARAR